MRKSRHFLQDQKFWEPIVRHWLQVVLPRLAYLVLVASAAWSFGVPPGLQILIQALMAKF